MDSIRTIHHLLSFHELFHGIRPLRQHKRLGWKFWVRRNLLPTLWFRSHIGHQSVLVWIQAAIMRWLEPIWTLHHSLERKRLTLPNHKHSSPNQQYCKLAFWIAYSENTISMFNPFLVFQTDWLAKTIWQHRSLCQTIPRYNWLDLIL